MLGREGKSSLWSTGKLQPVGSVSEGREPTFMTVVEAFCYTESAFNGIFWSLVDSPPSRRFSVDIVGNWKWRLAVLFFQKINLFIAYYYFPFLQTPWIISFWLFLGFLPKGLSNYYPHASASFRSVKSLFSWSCFISHNIYLKLSLIEYKDSNIYRIFCMRMR